MQGCVWYKSDLEAFYPKPGEDAPDVYNSFGILDRGYLVDVVGRFIDADGMEWVKIVRKNDAGLLATLWVPMTDMVSGRKTGVWFEHCFNIPNAGTPETSPFSGGDAVGKVIVLIRSGLYKDSALTNKLRDAVPGETFWFDTETAGVIRTWYKSGSTFVKLYFRRAGALAEGFSAPFPNLMLVATNGETQEQLWALVPEVNPDEPEPPEPDKQTIWEKIALFFKMVWELIKEIFLGEK